MNSERYHNKCIQVFVKSTRYFCHILITLEPSRQIFEKFSNNKFQENQSSRSRAVPCGRTYTMKLIAASCSSANAPINASNKLHSTPHYTPFPRNAPLPYFFHHFRDNLKKRSQRAGIIRLGGGTFPNFSRITDKS